MDFKLVKDVDAHTLDEWPAWAQFYERRDIDTLANHGCDREAVQVALEAVGWSDDYWFPIPEGAPLGAFEFEHRKALFRTPDGVEISGYVYNSGHSIGLFGRSDIWVINEDFLDLYEDERPAILEDLEIGVGVDLLPLEFEMEELGGKRVFPKNEGEQGGG